MADVVSAVAIMDGAVDGRMIKVTRSDGSVYFVPPAEGNREYEELSSLVATRQLTVTGGDRVGLTRTAVAEREARRSTELDATRTR